MLVYSLISYGQTNIKTMFYNLLNYDSNSESISRTSYLKTILSEIQPDLFMVCELKNEIASVHLYNNAILPFNQKMKSAPFYYSKSPDKSLQQIVYYNSEKLVLEYSTVIPTNIRDINHYTFKINTLQIDTNPIRIEVFVTHLKASQGSDNRQKRFESAENFTRELDRIPSDSYVLFAGDFNFYTSNEEGFKKIIDINNSIQIIDPINRLCPDFPDDGRNYYDENYNKNYFWNNSTFADIHSQSTRSSSLIDGAGGGMDDRFDFIMMSKNLQDNEKLFYKNGTYKSVGNNGNCYNSYVSNTSCSGEFSQDLRNALFYFSDHLPIVMEIETPENTLSIKDENPISFVNSNIVSNFLTINLSNLEAVKNIVIYNQLGQLIENVIAKEKNIQINTSNLSKGIYYLKTESHKPLKFIKI